VLVGARRSPPRTQLRGADGQDKKGRPLEAARPSPYLLPLAALRRRACDRRVGLATFFVFGLGFFLKNAGAKT